MQVEPPPPTSEDGSAIESARRRFVKSKQLNLGLPRFPYLKAGRTSGHSGSLLEHSTLPNDTIEIDLNDSGADLNTSQDIYRWGVVYENQRGFALASFVIQFRVLIPLVS